VRISERKIERRVEEEVMTSQQNLALFFHSTETQHKMNQNLKGITSQPGTHADVKPTPRVNKTLLPNYIGQIVRLVTFHFIEFIEKIISQMFHFSIYLSFLKNFLGK
jgi:hypothetical protein